MGVGVWGDRWGGAVRVCLRRVRAAVRVSSCFVVVWSLRVVFLRWLTWSAWFGLVVVWSLVVAFSVCTVVGAVFLSLLVFFLSLCAFVFPFLFLFPFPFLFPFLFVRFLSLLAFLLSFFFFFFFLYFFACFLSFSTCVLYKKKRKYKEKKNFGGAFFGSRRGLRVYACNGSGGLEYSPRALFFVFVGLPVFGVFLFARLGGVPLFVVFWAFCGGFFVFVGVCMFAPFCCLCAPFLVAWCPGLLFCGCVLVAFVVFRLSGRLS